jgi:hydroxymethylpyrimidine/phosphomethylpyrimidine kinase
VDRKARTSLFSKARASHALPAELSPREESDEKSMERTGFAKTDHSHRSGASCRLSFAVPAFAQANSPWENAVNVLQQAFTSTIARGLSLVAIVVSGLTFAFERLRQISAIH